MTSGAWQFAIDRGGTFTDCIGQAPDGTRHVAKLLSSDTAPVEGVRRILSEAGALGPDGGLPACRIRLGTTLATNALLERRGAPTALVANRGLGDLLEIGTQERPDLFALDIRKPAPLPARVIEVAGRVCAAGEPVGEIAAAELGGGRHHHQAQLHRAEQRLPERDDVGEHEQHPVAPAGTERAEPVGDLTAVVLVFDRDGGFLTTGRQALDTGTLTPGTEAAFVVTVAGAANVGRYRVSFRQGEHTLPHVDTRS